MLHRLLDVCEKEQVRGCTSATIFLHAKCLEVNTGVFHGQVTKTDDGLEAIVFTAQGDMRQVRRKKC